MVGLLMLCIRGWGDGDDGNCLLLLVIRGRSEGDLGGSGLLFFGGVKEVEGRWRVVCVSSCRSSGLGVLRLVSSIMGVLSPSYSAVIVDDEVEAGECVWLVESSVMSS